MGMHARGDAMSWQVLTQSRTEMLLLLPGTTG